MSKQLTVRGVSDEVAERLESLSRARGQSINTTVNEILGDALGAGERLRRLERFVTWSDDDLAQVTEAVAAQRAVDADLWR